MRELGIGTYLAAGFGGVVVPVLQFLYGDGETVLLWMCGLFLVILLDWISGTRASSKDKSYASQYGIDGIFRTFFMLLLPAGGHFIDMIFKLPGLAFGIFVGGLFWHTLKSAVANAVRAGWGNWLPIPWLEVIMKWVQSEIEAKIRRAFERSQQYGKGGNNDGA